MLFPHTWCKLHHNLWKTTNEFRGITWSSWQQLQRCDGLGRELRDVQKDTAGEFGTGQPSRESVSKGVMWLCQTAWISLKRFCRSLPVQNWSHEHSPCAPGNNLLSQEKKITEWALGIFSFTVLIQAPFEVFLLISSWLWSGYRGKRELIVKAAGGDLA